jgi:hypothetical protein
MWLIMPASVVDLPLPVGPGHEHQPLRRLADVLAAPPEAQPSSVGVTRE